MTVRIIGESPQAMRQATCSNCAAVLEFTDADTKFDTSHDYAGGSDTYRILVCPRCTNTLHVGSRSRAFTLGPF